MDYYVSKNVSEDDFHYKTLSECLKNVMPHDKIHLADEVYFEKITIGIPDLEMVGNNSVIRFDACSGLIIPRHMGGDGIKTFGTTGSATVTILPEANNFKASGIAFVNCYKREPHIRYGQAVSIKVSANSFFSKCAFVSTQDTLYVDHAEKIVFSHCLIKGDIDFIFGGANAIFYKSKIIALDQNKDAYIIAPSTKEENKHGLCFYNSTFYKEGDNFCCLGRPWQQVTTHRVKPKALFYRSEFDPMISFGYRFMDNDPVKSIDGLYHLMCFQNGMAMSNCTRYDVSETIDWMERTVSEFI